MNGNEMPKTIIEEIYNAQVRRNRIDSVIRVGGIIFYITLSLIFIWLGFSILQSVVITFAICAILIFGYGYIQNHVNHQ